MTHKMERDLANEVIVVEGLTKYFGKDKTIKALQDVSLTIYQGETFGLLGPNGAGKTTFVRLLTGIIRPTAGSATILGFDLLDNVDLIKKQTGLLAETAGLYEKLTAYEFLEFVGGLYKLSSEVLRHRIDELLKLMSLQDRQFELLENFSSGMKQKVLLAAAIIHDPPIVFFDEPTGRLDPRSARVVKDLIKYLAEKADKTIVVCSHFLSLVEELCDRVGVISEGRLVSVGTVDQLLSSTGAASLEEAFLELTGGHHEINLESWR